MIDDHLGSVADYTWRRLYHVIDNARMINKPNVERDAMLNYGDTIGSYQCCRIPLESLLSYCMTALLGFGDFNGCCRLSLEKVEIFFTLVYRQPITHLSGIAVGTGCVERCVLPQEASGTSPIKLFELSSPVRS